MELPRLTQVEKKALEEMLPHLNDLLDSLGHQDISFKSVEDPILLGAGEYTAAGKLMRKKFGEYMMIFTFLEVVDEEGNVLRVFCIVDRDGTFLQLNHNYISKEQADLIKGI